MSEINVLVRTQRIIVDPYSSSVSVINAGPQGPPGPSGGVTLEQVRDDLAAVLVAGPNITITHNDAANTITITASGEGGGVSLEEVRDDLANVLVAGPNVTVTPNDAMNTITISADGVGGYTYVTNESSPPASPSVGDTWFAPDTGNTYLRYNDGTSTVWMQTATSSGGIADVTEIDGGSATTVF